MKFAALGRNHILYNSIVALCDAGHELVLLGTAKAAREYQRNESDFEALAKKYNCPFFSDSNIQQNKYHDVIHDSGAQAAISINWPTLIREETIHLFRHSILNAHMGDLPRYRGNACPNWAILNNEDKMGLVIHEMNKDLDAGAILQKEYMPLDENTYIFDCYKFFEKRTPQMYIKTLQSIENNTVTKEEQSADPGNSLRCFPRLPEDSSIAWEMDARQLARLVRASAEPFAGAYCKFKDNNFLKIWRARAEKLAYPWCGTPGQVASINRQNKEVSILTGKDVLVLEEIEYAGLRTQDVPEILSSLRVRLANG